MKKRILLVTSIVLACGNAYAETGPVKANQDEHLPWMTTARESLRSHLEASIASQVNTVLGETIHAVGALPVLYGGRDYRPLWIGARGVNSGADELCAMIDRSTAHGLRPDIYHLGTLAATLPMVRQDISDGGLTDIDLAVELDLLLSDAFLLLSMHLLQGRVDPRSPHPNWSAPRRRSDLLAGLTRALESGEVASTIEGFAPQQAGYRRLSKALESYRAMERGGGWPKVPPGHSVKRGAAQVRTEALRKALLNTGDLPENAARGDGFDGPLEKALKAFQKRHGLEETGALDSETRVELEVPVADRVAQLEVALERFRWLPDDLGKRNVRVNIASFELDVYEKGRPVLEMRAVVGKQHRKTPVFSDAIRFLVLNPSWTVPRSITTEDILPRILGDRDYLKRAGFTLYRAGSSKEVEVDPRTVDWSKVSPDRFPYFIRQAPGPSNPLGRIKFAFPNSHAVYLHDTPQRELFKQVQRAGSSGCIRVERPFDLAEFLLREDPRWGRKALMEAIRTGREQKIPLREAVPIHILYDTAWVDEAGAVHFRRDLYSRDRHVILGLR